MSLSVPHSSQHCLPQSISPNFFSSLPFRLCFHESISVDIRDIYCSQYKIANTGALCCVAGGPHGVESPSGGGEYSIDNGEPHWRVNSSFSPPLSRIWDCRLQSDGIRQDSNRDPPHSSSLSSNSKGNRSRAGSDRYANHQHSVSDGVLSHHDTPPHNFQVPRWTSPVQKFNYGEFATSSLGGSRSKTWFPHSTERRYMDRPTAASPSFASPSSFSDSGHWESTSKQPFSVHSRNIPGRRSFMSKAVYPLVFRNPVSEYATFGDTDISSVGRSTPGEDRISPSLWQDNCSSVDHRFHKTISELHELGRSPDPNASSRRGGFRWSSASSYDMEFDGESLDIEEAIDVEIMRSPHGPVGNQKCGVCGKLLRQRSPWSSHQLMRGGDMPVAGVLPCSHVFHAECLEQMTPKTHIQDPPCPLCLKMVREVDSSPFVSEPLQMALRSVQRRRMGELQENQSNIETPRNLKDRFRRSLPRAMAGWSGSGSSMKNHLTRRWSSKGKASKEFFSTKMFRSMGSSSKKPVSQS